MLTPPNYLRRDPSNVTDDTNKARHTAHTAAGLRHEEAVLLTRILVGIVAVTTFVTHKHPFLANTHFWQTPISGNGAIASVWHIWNRQCRPGGRSYQCVWCLRIFFDELREQRGCPPTPVPKALPGWPRHAPGPSPVEGASGDQIEHSQLGSIFQTSKILNC